MITFKSIKHLFEDQTCCFFITNQDEVNVNGPFINTIGPFTQLSPIHTSHAYIDNQIYIPIDNFEVLKITSKIIYNQNCIAIILKNKGEQIMSNEKKILVREDIFDIIIKYVKMMAEPSTYDLNPEFTKKEVKRIFKGASGQFKKYDFESMSPEDLINLGFIRFTVEETGDELLLIPLYLKDAIKPNTELISIFGERKVVGVDRIDNDVRFGCIAYGFDYNKILNN